MDDNTGGRSGVYQGGSKRASSTSAIAAVKRHSTCNTEDSARAAGSRNSVASSLNGQESVRTALSICSSVCASHARSAGESCTSWLYCEQGKPLAISTTAKSSCESL